MNKIINRKEFSEWIAFSLDFTNSDVTSYHQKIKVLVQAFKSSVVAEVLLDQNQDLPRQLASLLKKTRIEQDVLLDNLRAFKGFAQHKKLHHLLIPAEEIEVLIKLAAEMPLDK